MATRHVALEDIHREFAWTRPMRWTEYRKRRIAPHEHSGIYVFTTYPGPLVSNDILFGLDGDIPRVGEADFAERAVEQRTVLYVGRAVRLSLRLADYLDRPGKCSHQLVRILDAHADRIWVRWSIVDDWEYGLIRLLQPEFNDVGSKLSGLKADLSRIQLDWQRPMRWADYARNPGAREYDLAGLPGYYVFTDYGGSLVPGMGDAGGRVLYVGRSKDLHRRMSEYLRASNSGKSCNEEIFRWLKTAASRTWVRWVVHFDHEEELIACLVPAINEEHSTI